MIRFNSILLVTSLCLVGILLVSSSCKNREQEDLPLPEVVDFNYHVKPILSDRCFSCHGPDNNARKADLRLDTEAGAKEQRLESGGYAFVAGNLKKSKAYQRMLSHDPELQMPPPSSNLLISDTELAILARWIKQGAVYKPHWAFIPPQAGTSPKVESGWANNEIDQFIGKKLSEQGLSPSSKANKEALIRRLSLDLTGLPPTIEEIDDFLADDSSDAYEKVVDRLLNSPHFGEKLAIDWLDLARYADSHGYQDDGLRNAWPWRDWVINAFNQNIPYDQFVTWQLAGDLLPDPTKGTAFGYLF